MEEGKEEKEEVVVEEEDEASAPEPDDSTPCPVCCEYISAHEMHLHVNKCFDRSLERQGNDAASPAPSVGTSSGGAIRTPGTTGRAGGTAGTKRETAIGLDDSERKKNVQRTDSK